jgi:hypothetical protein
VVDSFRNSLARCMIPGVERFDAIVTFNSNPTYPFGTPSPNHSDLGRDGVGLIGVRLIGLWFGLGLESALFRPHPPLRGTLPKYKVFGEGRGRAASNEAL